MNHFICGVDRIVGIGSLCHRYVTIIENYNTSITVLSSVLAHAPISDSLSQSRAMFTSGSCLGTSDILERSGSRLE